MKGKKPTKREFKTNPFLVTPEQIEKGRWAVRFAKTAHAQGFNYTSAFCAFCGYARLFPEADARKHQKLIELARVERARFRAALKAQPKLRMGAPRLLLV